MATAEFIDRKTAAIAEVLGRTAATAECLDR
jgi:hypothetical protein